MTVTATQTRKVFLEVDACTIGDATAVLLDEGGDFLVIREESTGWAIRECSMDAAVGATSEAGPSCPAPPDYRRDAFLYWWQIIGVVASVAALAMSLGIAWAAWRWAGLGAVTGFVSAVWALMRLAERWRDR